MRVSAVVITFNEVDRIQACLRSLSWCDEIIVLDSGSTDGTGAEAVRLGARLFVQDFAGYGQQKNNAAELASNEWVLNLDADECATSELREAVETCDFLFEAYRVRRDGLFMGRRHRPMHKASTDRPIRLYNRTQCSFSTAIVHESVEASQVGDLPGHIEHNSFRSMRDQADRFNTYSSLLVKQTPEKSPSSVRLVLRPLGHFLWSYFRQGAFRDGQPGFILSVLWAYHDFLVEAKRVELLLEKTKLPSGAQRQATSKQS